MTKLEELEQKEKRLYAEFLELSKPLDAKRSEWCAAFEATQKERNLEVARAEVRKEQNGNA